MQLSSILLQGLLLSSVIASPTGSTTAATPDVSEGSYADNSTEISAAGGNHHLCFEANEGQNCHGKSIGACSKYQQGKGLNSGQAKSYCSFWCSKIRDVYACKDNKKKFNYHPKWGCDGQKYCYMWR
ncbi:putative secreted protein [Wickerhamomyces ciferrii]|uniref:Secreted protein n=1 Tax=Wickerhamomyces ciferrii (strain ATCC 14091 / BCRC 22168 / CBS 111 / JCM 3599 / NBRC 0793 / NRRL Y-1031 F-60-10) TaxID=1206466 RepID=K0L0P7_WICCF|nr:uncharacterized protein BN7_6632 [Wickerhamomyces ciferrii]CCH47023.1 putative secreted protein [Wickerhamomyces ciferrii]